MPDACQNCKYGVKQEEHIYEDVVTYHNEVCSTRKSFIKDTLYFIICKRYPQTVRKDLTDYCGEYKEG